MPPATRRSARQSSSIFASSRRNTKKSQIQQEKNLPPSPPLPPPPRVRAKVKIDESFLVKPKGTTTSTTTTTTTIDDNDVAGFQETTTRSPCSSDVPPSSGCSPTMKPTTVSHNLLKKTKKRKQKGQKQEENNYHSEGQQKQSHDEEEVEEKRDEVMEETEDERDEVKNELEEREAGRGEEIETSGRILAEKHGNPEASIMMNRKEPVTAVPVTSAAVPPTTTNQEHLVEWDNMFDRLLKETEGKGIGKSATASTRQLSSEVRSWMRLQKEEVYRYMNGQHSRLNSSQLQRWNDACLPFLYNSNNNTNTSAVASHSATANATTTNLKTSTTTNASTANNDSTSAADGVVRPDVGGGGTSSSKTFELHPSNKRSLDHCQWEMMFHELLKFKKEYGHCRVPRRFPDNPRLGRWVAKQRTEYVHFQNPNRRPLITAERIQRLEEVNFEWAVRKKYTARVKKFFKWDQLFSKLIEYRQIHGTWDPDPLKEKELSKWVQQQRTNYYSKITNSCNDNNTTTTTTNNNNNNNSTTNTNTTTTTTNNNNNNTTNTNTTTTTNNNDNNNSDDDSSAVLTPERITLLDGVGFDWKLPGTPTDATTTATIVNCSSRNINGSREKQRWETGTMTPSPSATSTAKNRSRKRALPTNGKKKPILSWSPSIVTPNNSNNCSTASPLTDEVDNYSSSSDAMPMDNKKRKKMTKSTSIINTNNHRKNTGVMGCNGVQNSNTDFEPTNNRLHLLGTVIGKMHFDENVEGQNKHSQTTHEQLAVQEVQQIQQYEVHEEDEEKFTRSKISLQQWHQMLYKLLVYETVHGHARVPYPYKEDPSLGIWVQQMMSQRKTLLPSQIRKLDAIGFEWASPSKDKYQQ